MTLMNTVALTRPQRAQKQDGFPPMPAAILATHSEASGDFIGAWQNSKSFSEFNDKTTTTK